MKKQGLSSLLRITGRVIDKSEGRKAGPVDSKPEALSTRPHHLLSGIVFAKDQHLIWLSEGKTASALHGPLSGLLTMCHEVCEIHTHSFLPSSEVL